MTKKSPTMPRRVLAALLLALLATAGVALAQGPRDVRVVTSFLALTEEQSADWEQIRQDARDAIAPLAEQVRTLEGELHDLLAGDDPDPTAVGTVVVAISDLRHEIAGINLVATEAFVALLDETQLEKLTRVRRAAPLCRVVPSFQSFGLLRPPGPPPE